MEAHGGYLLRLAGLDRFDLLALARRVLSDSGISPVDVGLAVSSIGPVARVAFDAPFSYGEKGALFYERHPGLATALSTRSAEVIHIYGYQPEFQEFVVSIGGGRQVGGERVVYDEQELPDVDDGEDDEYAYQRMQARWPLSHLARVLGVRRDDLLRLARAPTVLLPLDGLYNWARAKKELRAAFGELSLSVPEATLFSAG